MTPDTPRPAQIPGPTDQIVINLVQGQYRVSTDPAIVFTTTLGSCVSMCVRDPLAQVGGINHFLLPDGDAGSGLESLRYGVHAMEIVINEMLHLGGRRNRMEAKLFGGARLMENLPDVGSKNVEFAKSYLNREGIKYAGGSTGGQKARRIQFWPGNGRVRQMLIARTAAIAARVERQSRDTPPPSDGAVEWFSTDP